MKGSVLRENMGGVPTFKGRWRLHEEDALGTGCLGGTGGTREVQGMESKVEKLHQMLPRF